MMRLLICAVLLGLVQTAFGEDLGLSLTETTVVRSQYVFGNGNVASDKPVVQTDLCLSLKNGAWVDLWGSAPTDLGKIGKDYRTELYLTAGWTGMVGDYKLTLYAGLDDLYQTGTFNKSDFLVFAGEISRDFKVSESLTLSPFIHVETNFTFDGVVQGDTLPRLGSYYSWQINKMLSLDGKVYLLYDPGIMSNQTALVGNLEGSLHWKIADGVTLELPYVRWVSPLTSVSDGRKEEWVYGIGLSGSPEKLLSHLFSWVNCE